MTTSLQKTLEQRLAALVAQRTVSHDIAENRTALDLIAKELASYGFHIHQGGPNHPWLAATTRRTKHPKILLAAHIDVVEPSDPSQYTMHIKNGKIYGRGTFDMKFAIAGYLEFARRLSHTADLADYDFGILLTSDEELGGYDGVKHWLDEGWRTNIAVIPDGGRDWKLEKQAKGIMYLYLDSAGASTHSSRPWEGKNAIHGLVAGLQEIVNEFPNTDQHGTIVSINAVQTSGALELTTRTPNHARASIDIRAFTVAEMEQAQATLFKIAARHSLAVTVALNEPPVHLDMSNPNVQDFIQCLTEVRGRPVEYTNAFGASDARHLATYGIPTVLLYPTGGEAHSATEWMAREDLSTFYHLVETYIARTAHDPHAHTNESALARQFTRYKQMISRSLRKH